MSDKLKQKIEDAKVEGWSLHKEQTDRAVMVRRGYGTLGGHVLVFLLAGWWTIGLANAAYAAYKYFGDNETKVLRVDRAASDD